MSSRLQPLFGRGAPRWDKEDHWLSISDLMSGLMIIFLFVAIAYMRHIRSENLKMKEVAVAYQENQVAIYHALMEEFKDDLSRWQALINKETLAFEFAAPEVLFDNGEIVLKDTFQQILADFFPRYVERLRPFRESINEVRIEGHTSSIWNLETSDTDAYFNNMWLSQGRTRSVLEYVYQLPTVSNEQQWIKKYIAAVGFSSSHPVLNPDGSEDDEASRRVTFRVITNAEIQIRKILEG